MDFNDVFKTHNRDFDSDTDGAAIDDESPNKKPSKRYCSFSSTWKTTEFDIDVGGNIVKKFSGNVLKGNDGDDAADCTLCKVQFSVRHGEANDVRKHFSSAKHILSVLAKKTTRPLSHLSRRTKVKSSTC